MEDNLRNNVSQVFLDSLKPTAIIIAVVVLYIPYVRFL